MDETTRNEPTRKDSDMFDKASTPDPDSPPCDECGGGLAHYPECSTFRRPEWIRRRSTKDLTGPTEAENRALWGDR